MEPKGQTRLGNKFTTSLGHARLCPFIFKKAAKSDIQINGGVEFTPPKKGKF